MRSFKLGQSICIICDCHEIVIVFDWLFLRWRWCGSAEWCVTDHCLPVSVRWIVEGDIEILINRIIVVAWLFNADTAAIAQTVISWTPCISMLQWWILSQCGDNRRWCGRRLIDYWLGANIVIWKRKSGKNPNLKLGITSETCWHREGDNTHIGDYHCSIVVALINLVNCTIRICYWPICACLLQNRRPNSMCDEAFSHQTYAEIFACDAPTVAPNQLVRIDPNRWHPLICYNFDPCSIPNKIVPVIHLVSV